MEAGQSEETEIFFWGGGRQKDTSMFLFSIQNGENKYKMTTNIKWRQIWTEPIENQPQQKKL